MYSSSASLLCVYFAITTRYPSSHFTTLSYRSNEYGTTNFKRESPKEKIVLLASGDYNHYESGENRQN